MQQPVLRFCPTCGTDVEDVGGFCRLGHSLRVSAPTADLSTLKAEVDAAFEEAKLEVAAALGRLAPGAPVPYIPDVVRVEPQPSPAPAPVNGNGHSNGTGHTNGTGARPVATAAQMLTEVNRSIPATKAVEPVTRELTPPPPPEAPKPLYTPAPVVGANDPITAFAPPPHMDWGPQRSRFRRRK